MVNEIHPVAGQTETSSKTNRCSDFEPIKPESNCEVEILQLIPEGNETILLVEDEDFVRDVTREVLEMAGYKVLEAQDAQTGLRVFNEHRGEVHLLLTDIVMPGMNGHDLAQRLTEYDPGLRAIYMSGYTGNEVDRRCLTNPNTHYLQKPFTVEALARKVREVLDAPEASSALFGATEQQPAVDAR